MRKGANSISALCGADKSDEKLITLKLVILSKLFPLLPEGLFYCCSPRTSATVAVATLLSYCNGIQNKLIYLDAFHWNDHPLICNAGEYWFVTCGEMVWPKNWE
jgi:hypothetical protein